jgi:hypothetical protein
MTRTVTVEDEHGGLFRCTRQQFDILHYPAGRTLIADEDGQPVSQKATKPQPAADSGTREE